MKLLLVSLLFLLSSACAGINSSAPKEIKLTPQNTINLRTQVDGESVGRVMAAVEELRKSNPDGDLYLVLNSPGGSIIDGMDLIRYLEGQKNIHTISIFAASMAAAIFEINPGKRYVVKDGIVMFHRPSGGFQGTFNDGEVESRLAFFKKIVTAMEQQQADRIGISLQDYKSKVKDEWWISGKDAVDANVADAIVAINCSKELKVKEEVLEFRSMFGSATVTFSACPLFTNPIKVVEGGR